jgi:pilus assembly protein CpaE
MDPTLASMRNTLRLLALPNGPDQVRRAVIVLNRLGQPGGLTRQQVEEALEMTVDLVVPYQPRPVNNAATLGTPATSVAGAFRVGIQHLAREVAFVSEAGPEPAIAQEAASGLSLSRLFSKIGRKS